MIVLAIDSSATTISAAVLIDGEPVAERSWRARTTHSEGLFSAIEAVLADSRTDVDRISLIAVATGPGSFNGIRAGIASAEGIRLGLRIPAVGIPTLDALAYQQSGRAEIICAVLPAGRGDLYAATYAGTGDVWQPLDGYSVDSPEQLVERLAHGTLLCGRVTDDVARLATANGLEVAPAALTLARATFIGALAASRFRTPGFEQRASLRPLYLRRPGVTTPSRPLALARIDAS
jgi:tRNA threonylcarbamoyladenosine biosynthesis protein TsaB